MVSHRRLLRLIPFPGVVPLRGSHYRLSPSDGMRQPRFSRPRERATPMPCHIVNCACGRFTRESQRILCPVCSREYAGRGNLEMHFYGKHPGLSVRDRSVLLRGVVYPLVGTNNSWKETAPSISLI